MDLRQILTQMGFHTGVNAMHFTSFQCDEDGSDYAVWKVCIDGKNYVLKQAKEYEAEVYSVFLKNIPTGVPQLYAAADDHGKTYLLMEYIPGENLRVCSRPGLVLALDALIAIQDFYWEKHAFDRAGYCYEKSLPERINRGKYLNDPELEKAYETYLKLYSTLPRTLCHDDLLPFNVLVTDTRAVIIDWEYAGMLPYPTALARLIAHGTDDETAFFYMTGADKAFAIEYYYVHLLQGKGISYADYCAALSYFFLFEYCEWVMIGNRCGNTETARYQQYYALAKRLARKLNGPLKRP